MTRHDRALPPRPATEAALTRGRRWAALVVLTASLFVITMDMTILNIALPEITAGLHPSSDQMLWMVDAYSLVLAGLLIPMAAVADRWGRRRMIVMGYAIFAIASLLVLVAESAGAVIAIRALLGVGGSMIMPTTLSLIRVIFADARERATALSIWAAVSGLGAVVGPLVGGLLLQHFSWHAAFLVNVPLMVAGVVAGVTLLPESRVAHAGPWDVVAAGLAFVGMVALVWSMKQFGKQATITLPQAWTALAIAATALGWFVLRNLRSSNPLLELWLFRSRQFSAGTIAALGSTFSMVATLLLIAQWLQLVDGASPMEAGVRLMPMAVVGAFASLVAPPLSRRLGARATLAGGLAIAGLGMAHLGLTGEDVTLSHMLLTLSLVGVGMGALAVGSAMIMGAVTPDKAGSAGALEETSYEFGATMGVTLLGSISALVYRSDFTGSAGYQELKQVNPALAVQSEELLGAAKSIADELKLPEAAEHAAQAFTHSLQVAGSIGGLTLLTVAVTVFLLTPKGIDPAGSR